MAKKNKKSPPLPPGSMSVSELMTLLALLTRFRHLSIVKVTRNEPAIDMVIRLVKSTIA